jgi:hypothetical protein
MKMAEGNENQSKNLEAPLHGPAHLDGRFRTGSSGKYWTQVTGSKRNVTRDVGLKHFHSYGEQINDKMVGECSMHEGKEKKRIRNVNQKPEGRTQLGKSKRRWKNYIKIFLKEIQY